AYILNRVPSKSVPLTPYEMWYGRKPSLEGLRLWGSGGFVHNTSHKHGKLGPRAVKHIFIRYCDHSKGYVMYGEHPDGGMTEIESHDVNFLDEVFPTIGEVKGALELYELQNSQGGAPIPGEDEASQPYPIIDGDNASDLKSVRVTHWKKTLKIYKHVRANVEIYPIGVMKSKGNLSCVLL
ncbi:hypothetical protein Pfo_018392, partial [Paulownia fortunei]